MKIGLYFGTFNPIHIGHMIIANHMSQFSDLEEVWFVVTPHNPFKEKSTLLGDNHRYQMVCIATEDFPKLKASNIEFSLPKPNYTINTLIYLYEKYPGHEFNLIMGEDNLQSFYKWKNYETILKNHHLYVYPRVFNNKEKSALHDHPKVNFIDAPIVEISSTFIRNAIKDKKDIRVLLPHNVWKYLDEMNFYK
jgi:nicotinate-nucleotide adenylyltransferase